MLVGASAARSGDSWQAATSVRPIGGTDLALVRIHTGVTHQIRATCAALGSPVEGDTVYENEKNFTEIHHERMDAETVARFDKLEKDAQRDPHENFNIR